MSASTTNQVQMRPATLTGSPKKNAAWRSLSNITLGSSPGAVATYQKTDHGQQQRQLVQAQVLHATAFSCCA
jgi:hypothetical protein